MSFHSGDKVKFLNDVGEATILKVINTEMVLIKTEEGFEYNYPVNELVKVVIDTKEPIVFQPKADKTPQKKSSLKYLKKHLSTPPKKNKRNVVEIDLHIEELVEFPHKLEHHEKLSYQISYFKKCLNEARRARIPNLVIIHGVGEGKLKTEIRTYLNGLGDVEYEDGSYKEYGFGATKINIRGLFS